MPTTSTVEQLYDSVQSYSKVTYELSKLKALDTTTVVVTTLITKLSVAISVTLFTLVMNIGIAMMLGDMLGKAYYGYFIVAAFYLLLALIFHFFLKKWIQKPISELIIVQALQQS